MKRITITLILTISGLTYCQAEDQKSDEILLTTALLLNSSGFVRYGDATAASDAHALTVRTNPAGQALSDFGDGSGDGFTDHFITPKEVSISLLRVVAYKSPEAGGVPPGSETIENADYILYDGVQDYASWHEGREGAYLLPYSVRAGDSTPVRGLQSLPADADRVAMEIPGVYYQYDPGFMQDPVLQTLFLDYGTSTHASVDESGSRGQVQVIHRASNCPPFQSQMTLACSGWTFDLLQQDGKYQCRSFGPSEDKLYPCTNTISGPPGPALEFAFPSGAAAGENYLQVMDVSNNTGSGRMYINIDPKNTLFIDSNAAKLDSFDRASWAQSKASEQDLEVYLPYDGVVRPDPRGSGSPAQDPSFLEPSGQEGTFLLKQSGPGPIIFL